ncbi:hypothetical protein Nmel_010056 [Mimus melanotis]
MGHTSGKAGNRESSRLPSCCRVLRFQETLVKFVSHRQIPDGTKLSSFRHFSSSPVTVELSTWWCSFGTSRRHLKIPDWEENSCWKMLWRRQLSPGISGQGAGSSADRSDVDLSKEGNRTFIIRWVETSDVRDHGGRHCEHSPFNLSAELRKINPSLQEKEAGRSLLDQRSQCSVTKCHSREGRTRVLGSTTKGSGDVGRHFLPVFIQQDPNSFWKVELQFHKPLTGITEHGGDVVQHFQTSKSQQLMASLGKAWLHFIPHFCWRGALNMAGGLLLDGETEAPPACGERIKSHQARLSSRAELLVSAQKVLAALCLSVVLSV